MYQEEYRRWQNAFEGNVRRQVLFEAERGDLFAFFEQQGIWYLPLKGILIQKLYPEFGMREMSDNDILFDSEKASEVREWMQNRGYRLEAERVVDAYYKEPIYNFELHHALIGKGFGRMVSYFQSFAKRRIQNEKGIYEYHFSSDDMYLYVIGHAWKHYQRYRSGLRVLVDVYLLRTKGGLHEEYLQGELEQFGGKEYENLLHALSLALFSDNDYPSDKPLSEDQLEMLRIMQGAGAYGTTQNRVKEVMRTIQGGELTINGTMKRQYLIKRFFPPKEVMQSLYPVLKKASFLLPVMHVYRWISGICKRSRTLFAEFKALLKL